MEPKLNPWNEYRWCLRRGYNFNYDNLKWKIDDDFLTWELDDDVITAIKISTIQSCGVRELKSEKCNTIAGIAAVLALTCMAAACNGAHPLAWGLAATFLFLAITQIEERRCIVTLSLKSDDASGDITLPFLWKEKLARELEQAILWRIAFKDFKKN